MAPAAESVLVASTITSQHWPLEMNTFCPEITKSSPSRTALVRMALRSEPACGSVMPSEPIASPVTICGSQRRFCSSLPKDLM
ncbi:hypothetical protein D9M69_724970 [compost metagenome]